MITGGTDGIGKGLALEFARRGFNLIILSRN
jgi:short-subunit dehydrogenase